MKIRQKLTLISTCMTALILIGVSIAIYYFFSLYRQIEFYDRLKDRASIIAQVHLERDELSEDAFRAVQKKYRQTLSNEIIGLFEIGYPLNLIQDSLKVDLPLSFFESVPDSRYVEVKSGDRQAVGMYYRDNQGDFVVLVSAIDRFGAIELADLQKILIACFFVSIIFIFISGWFFSQQALKPITGIIREVNSIRLSNLHLRLSTDNSKDEIAELSTTFNKMLERLETSLEIQKNFISNASHELKNPLTAIIGQVDLALGRERSAESYKAALQTIAYEAKRLDNLTSKLLDLAQTDFDENALLNEDVRMDELIMEVHDDLNNLAPGCNVHINFEHIPEDEQLITIRGNKKLLHAALVNVLENACKYSDNQKVSVLIKADKSELKVSTADKGIGISEQDLQNIFQPFYRGDNARGYKGFGIGLSLTEKIVRMHGGEISIHSRLGEGTDFMIILPQNILS